MARSRKASFTPSPAPSSTPLQTLPVEAGRTYTDPDEPGVARQRALLTERRASFEQEGGIRTTGLDLPRRRSIEREYERRGWQDLEAEHAAAAPSMHDYAHLAEHGINPFPQPPRWEDLPADQQQRAHNALAAHGTSMDKMIEDIGRGLDRGYLRAEQYGHVTPFASDFYEPGGYPRRAMTHALPGMSDVAQAGAIAMTSPQNKFIQVTGSGQANMPNLNAAVAAAHFGKVGHEAGWGAEDYRSIPGEELNAVGRTVSGGGVGLHGNVRRAAFAVGQGLAGTDIANIRGFPTKEDYEKERDPIPVFGRSPKASPFAGSFIDEAAPFHVADVHMAGLAFPHLSSIKGSGTGINPSGASSGTKSERELAIDRSPHIHSAMDYAVRQAMARRGLSKTRYNQGVGWGEEQITRTIAPEPGARRLHYNPDTMYNWSAQFQKRSKKGVGTLFLPGSMT